jgi:hypothetical protein
LVFSQEAILPIEIELPFLRISFEEQLGDEESLTPKGLGLPYVGFSDSGQAAVNAINFWIF